MTAPSLSVKYLRISDDREGAGLGIERQGADCDALAARLGLQPPIAFPDNDLTAYNKTNKHRRRPKYEEMCEFLRQHQNVVILAWHTDRIHRTPRELEDFIDLVEAGGHTVETVKAGPMDLRTPIGRMVARNLCAIARYESEHRAERIARKHLELAEAGAVSGGGGRPYGYEEDRVTIRESEANPLRWAYEQVIGGASLRSTATALNAAGHLTVEGTQWGVGTLGRVLRRPRNGGLRIHKGVIASVAVWPGIVDREVWERAQAIMSAAGHKKGNSTARKYLLNGFAVCGAPDCGTKLVARPTTKRSASMVCASGVPFNGCGKIRVAAFELEQMVSLYVVKALQDERLLAGLRAREAFRSRGSADVVAAIELSERKLAQLQAALEAGADDVPEVVAATRTVRAEVAVLRARLASSATNQVLATVDPETIAERWASESFTLEMKRSLMGAVVAKVIVGPALTRGLNRFDPRRVNIVEMPWVV